jgi:CRP-like cAMP-binding protein
VATLAVVAAVNPWREDRLPDRFPTIVQDSLIIALFALVAILFMQEKILATTAVGAVVIGFALQDTLGNLFSGLAIQIEKPFRVGQWVTIGGTDGIVMEVTWRATKMRTKAGNFVIVPNSVIAKETITNYSEPTRLTRIEVPIGASYDTPPNEVKTVIVEALHGEPLLSAEPEPEVLIADFAASSITYLVRVWTADFAADSRVRDTVRSRIYYAFRRHQITIPYPIQVEYHGETPPPAAPDSLLAPLRSVALFAALTDDQRLQLVRGIRPALYAAGEIIVREGARDTSMFVVLRGEAAVSLAGTDGHVAALHAGDFFGEMSLLTGEPRTATVAALTDCDVIEIAVDAFRAVVVADPSILDRVSAAVESRRAGLAHHRTTRTAAVGAREAPHSLLSRVREFLGLATQFPS